MAAAPSTSEWSTILLPTNFWLKLEVRRYLYCDRGVFIGFFPIIFFRIIIFNRLKSFTDSYRLWEIQPVFEKNRSCWPFAAPTHLLITYIFKDGVLDDMKLFFILSCLILNICFYCIVQDSLYHNMDIVTMWHCQLHPITVHGIAQYNNVIMSAMASQINSLTIVCWTIYTRCRS